MDRLTNYLHITVLVSTVLSTGVIFASSARAIL
jgi:hypothetical protein